MSTGPENKASLLGPIADEYEPTAADADRVFAKIQAAIGQATAATAYSTTPSPASATNPSSIPPAIGGGFGKKMVLVGLSCVALAIFGTFVVARGDAPVSTAPVATTPAIAPPAAPAPASEARSPVEGAQAIPSVSVDSLPSARTTPAANKDAPKPTPATTTTVPSGDTLEREARLLADSRQARQAGDGARALALLDEHARTFPNGWLASDRAAERIVVLCGLGRRDEAIREARLFLEGRSKGPLTRRVEMSCAGSGAVQP